MTDRQKADLYDLLTAACQNAGVCTDATYVALHDAVDSIQSESDDEA